MKVNNHKVNNHEVNNHKVNNHKVNNHKVNNHKVVRIWTYDDKVAVLCPKGWKYSSKTG